MKNFKPRPIEKNILPLVNAINETRLFKTFSSCEGHYLKDDFRSMNRNHADVRFDPIDGISSSQAEYFITFLMTEFNNRILFLLHV